MNEKTHNMEARNTEEFQVNHANTGRLKDSSIPYMQRLLNSDANKIKQDVIDRRIRRPGWNIVCSTGELLFVYFVILTPSLGKNTSLSLSLSLN